MPVITISRQYASGGSDIAKRVADRLDWLLLDNEFVDRVAERAGLTRQEVEAREERTPGLIERLASALAISSPEIFVATGEAPDARLGREDELVRVTEAVINEAVKAGNAVMVGRGAQAYLAQREDTLHVFVVAPQETRVRAAMARLGLVREDAEGQVDSIDEGRRRYVKTHYQRKWDDAANYHLVINTGVFNYDQAAELVVQAAMRRGFR